MKIVIDIDDEQVIFDIKNRGLEGESETDKVIINALYNGTPLPKGHGRLIAEPTEEDIAKTIGGQNDFAECIREAVKAVFDDAPTIIKEDKELEQPDKCKFFKDADCCYPIEDCNNCPNHKENDISDLELIIGYMSAIRKMIKGTQMDVSLFINSDENFPIAHINFLNDETGRLVKHITCNVDDEGD